MPGINHHDNGSRGGADEGGEDGGCHNSGDGGGASGLSSGLLVPGQAVGTNGHPGYPGDSLNFRRVSMLLSTSLRESLIHRCYSTAEGMITDSHDPEVTLRRRTTSISSASPDLAEVSKFSIWRIYY